MNSPKYILLARPSKFIVNEMKRLVTEAGFEPKPLANLAQIHDVDERHVCGVVISLSTNSVVDDPYEEVLKEVEEKFKGKPVFLASLLEMGRMKKVVKHRLRENNIQKDLLRITDAKNIESVNFALNLIVIEKTDIVDESLYPTTLEVMKKLCQTA